MQQQCQRKLEAMIELIKVKSDLNGIELLNLIELVIYKFEDHRYECESYYIVQKKVWNNFQKPETELLDYLNKFKHKIDVVESYGSKLGADIILISNHKDYYELDFTDPNLTIRQVIQHNQYLIKKKTLKTNYWKK